jgi:hypothetical protein
MSRTASAVLALVVAVAVVTVGAYLLIPRSRGVGPLPAEATALLGDPVLVAGLDAKYALSALQDMFSLAGVMTPGVAWGEYVAGKEKVERALREVETRAGVRLGRDVEQLAFSMLDLDSPEPHGVLLVVGHFDESRVLAAAEAALKEAGEPAAARQVHGVTTLPIGDDGLFAVPNHRVAIVGNAAAVETVLAGRTRSPADNELARLLGRVRAGHRFWLAGGERLMSRAGREVAAAAFLGLDLPKSFVVTESASGMEIWADMEDAAGARKWAERIRDRLGQTTVEAAHLPPAEPPLEARTEGRTLHVRATRGGFLTGPAGVGVVAAIAIPALLRARMNANESAAIADLRTVISAQATFASVSGGYYGEMRCLAEPQSCLPDYSGPTFLDPTLASLAEKSGYRRTFFAGPPGPKPGTLQGYALTLAPVTPQRTGIRSFCGGDDGVICERLDGQMIVAEGGRCPADCEPTR